MQEKEKEKKVRKEKKKKKERKKIKKKKERKKRKKKKEKKEKTPSLLNTKSDVRGDLRLDRNLKVCYLGIYVVLVE